MGCRPADERAGKDDSGDVIFQFFFNFLAVCIPMVQRRRGIGYFARHLKNMTPDMNRQRFFVEMVWLLLDDLDDQPPGLRTGGVTGRCDTVGQLAVEKIAAASPPRAP